MKRRSTIFLKIAVILIGIPILALCIFLLPQIANEAFEQAKGEQIWLMYFNYYVRSGDTFLYCIVPSI